MSREEMVRDLLALAERFSEGWHDGIKIDALDIELLADAARALAEQPAQQGPVAWAHKHINATLAAFGPGEAISMTKETWAKLREAMSVLIEQPAQQEPAGSVYRYGKDSSGKQWHGIRWTASGLDLPDGTLIYTSPPVQRETAAWTLLLTGEHHGLVGKAGEKFVGHPEHYERVDVYTSPRRAWVELTDEEIPTLTAGLGPITLMPFRETKAFVRAIEAKLRKKNT